MTFPEKENFEALLPSFKRERLRNAELVKNEDDNKSNLLCCCCDYRLQSKKHICSSVAEMGFVIKK